MSREKACNAMLPFEGAKPRTFRGMHRTKAGNALLSFGGCLQPRPPGSIEGPQPFDYISAGGDMRVAEERLKAATAIHFRP